MIVGYVPTSIPRLPAPGLGSTCGRADLVAARLEAPGQPLLGWPFRAFCAS
jgi:hypothetical protein